MSENAFCQLHLDGIRRVLSRFGHDTIVAKRSRVYTKAVVVGRPGEPGAIMVSLVDDLRDGRTGWLVTLFSEAAPEDVANGRVGFEAGISEEIWYWGDMLLQLEKSVREGFDKNSI